MPCFDSGYEIVSENVTVNSGTYGFDLSAPTGKVVLSGGFSAPSGATVHESYPSADDTWHFELSGSGDQTDVYIYVVCVSS